MVTEDPIHSPGWVFHSRGCSCLRSPPLPTKAPKVHTCPSPLPQPSLQWFPQHNYEGTFLFSTVPQVGRQALRSRSPWLSRAASQTRPGPLLGADTGLGLRSLRNADYRAHVTIQVSWGLGGLCRVQAGIWEPWSGFLSDYTGRKNRRAEVRGTDTRATSSHHEKLASAFEPHPPGACGKPRAPRKKLGIKRRR